MDTRPMLHYTVPTVMHSYAVNIITHYVSLIPTTATTSYTL